jgi:hypothetical protein
MEKYLTKESIEKAVDWWVDKLRSPVFDNGDSSFTGFMTRNMAQSAVVNKSLSKDQLDMFKNELMSLLSDYKYKHLALGCDYGPGRYLHEAGVKAGIPREFFSWKTCVVVNLEDSGDSVAMSKVGYGSEFKVI